MNKIYFVNDGEIDLRCITTFGVSVKEIDNPIGFFGTGLKYAIAIILRNGGKFILYRGLQKYEFAAKTELIRGKEFGIISMNDTELSFTTDLGKTWKMWQAFRELYCNTSDENGQCTDEFIEPALGKTVIVIEDDDFYNVFKNKDEIILSGSPIYDLGEVEVHEYCSSNFFYKNIRVGLPDKTPMFTYSFKSGVTLTEDRTISNSAEVNYIIVKSVAYGNNNSFIERFLKAETNSFESGLDFQSHLFSKPSQCFMEVMSRIDFKHISNFSAVKYYQKYTDLKKAPKLCELNDIERQQLIKAIAFCEGIGFIIDINSINVTDDLPENNLGKVYMEKIYISRRAFMQGTKQVAATVLEEWLHLEKKYSDETYEFQTYLFDLVVTLGERLNGEPL